MIETQVMELLFSNGGEGGGEGGGLFYSWEGGFIVKCRGEGGACPPLPQWEA